MVNPLADWDQEEIWWYINKHDLPYNPLHDEGFPSIGCFPCTSPVDAGEDERAGRWTNLQKTECGMHVPDINPAKRSSADSDHSARSSIFLLAASCQSATRNPAAASS